jgi:hypothetical protein
MQRFIEEAFMDVKTGSSDLADFALTQHLIY